MSSVLAYKKVLHRVNFEDVSIEAKLEKSHYMVGEQVNGVVEVRSGSHEADLGYLYLYLKSEYVKNPSQPLVRTEAKLDKFIIGQPFHMQAGQVVHIPFSIALPFNTPITYGSAKVFIHTGLDVHAGDDPEDIDYIEVGPSLFQEKVFRVVESLGYEKKRAVYGPTEKPNEFRQTFRYEKESYPIHRLLFSFLASNEEGITIHVQKYLTDSLYADQAVIVHETDSELEIKRKLVNIIAI